MMHVKTKFYAITVIKIIVYDLLSISKTYKKDFFTKNNEIKKVKIQNIYS
jgi:hypothetical protein